MCVISKRDVLHLRQMAEAHAIPGHGYVAVSAAQLAALLDVYDAALAATKPLSAALLGMAVNDIKAAIGDGS